MKAEQAPAFAYVFLFLSVVELRLRNRGPEVMRRLIGDRENWPVLPRSHFILRQIFPGKPGPFQLGYFSGFAFALAGR